MEREDTHIHTKKKKKRKSCGRKGERETGAER